MLAGVRNYPGKFFRKHTRVMAADGRISTNRKVKRLREYHSKNPEVPIQDILNWGATGSLDDVKTEAQRFAGNSLAFDQEVVEFVENEFKHAMRDASREPIPYEVAAEQ
jgi:hypothetical protein